MLAAQAVVEGLGLMSKDGWSSGMGRWRAATAPVDGKESVLVEMDMTIDGRLIGLSN